MSNKRDHFSCFDSNEVNKSSYQMEVISSLKDLKIPPKFIFILIFEPFTPFISLLFLRLFLSPHFLFFFGESCVLAHQFGLNSFLGTQLCITQNISTVAK